MDDKILAYLSLDKVFSSHGFKLYLVGGTVRDYLLGIPLDDMDAVTDTTPEDMKKFLTDANYRYEKFGSISYKIDGIKFDITTMREEKSYLDSRHPGEIKFIKELSKDVIRRDFTINALYLDKDLKVIDYVNGQVDLKNRILKTVGDADKRIKEDPLRILRAFRFACDYDLSLDNELDFAIRNNIALLDKLNIEKIKLDLKKCKASSKDKLRKIFKEYNIKHLLNVIE